jgi:ketosteroid isomerase-like protein
MTPTQAEQDSIALVRRGFEAFAAGDLQTLADLFDADARWHVVPLGLFAGDYRGRDQILGWFGQLQQETKGTFRSTPTAFAATGDRVFAQTTATAQRNGKTLEEQDVLVFSIADGRVASVHHYLLDYPSAAEFWS